MIPLSPTDDDLWRDLVEKEMAYLIAHRAFLVGAKNRTAVVRNALRGRDRHTALGVVRFLTEDERKELFETLVFLASSAHGSIGAVRDLVLSLPREWVLSNIEREAEPYLRDGTYDEYRRFLELYEELDPDMTQRLARLRFRPYRPRYPRGGRGLLG